MIDPIKRIKSLGFVLEVEGHGLFKKIENIEELNVLLSDVEQYLSDIAGVHKNILLEFIKTDGFCRCVAKTKKGRRCRNPVAGTVGQISIKKFDENISGFCTVHGG